MELLYIWIEEYKNIKNQGFNFSREYDISFDKENNELKVDKKENPTPKGFFGENISNITAIVGKNGSGKTNLIDWLFENSVPIQNRIYNSKEWIIIYKNSIGKLIIENKIKKIIEKNYIDIKIESEEIKWETEKEKKSLEDWVKTWAYKVRRINFSGFLKEETSIYDGNLVAVINEKRFKKETLEFLIKNKEILIKSKDREMQNLGRIDKIYIDKIIDSKEDYYSQLKSLKFFYEKLLEKCMQIKDKLEGKDYEELIEIKDDFDSIIPKYIKENKEINEIINGTNGEEKISKINEIKEIAFEVIKEIKKEVDIREEKNWFEEKYVESIKYYKKLKSLKDENEINKEVIEKAIKKAIKKDDTSIFTSFKKINILNVDERNERVWFSIDGYSKITKIFEIKDIYKIFKFSFNQELSTGSKSLINLFSDIKKKFDDDKLVGKVENVEYFLIFDEVSSYFHPNWERRFVDILISFLNLLAKEKKIELQILISGHSPYVVSDLPRDNVILLDKYDKNDIETKKNEKGESEQEIGNCKVVDSRIKNIKTFGANIHTLLSDAFFMESTIGEFAKNKIKDVIKDLDKKIKGEETEVNHDEIKFIINNLGEPIIQRKLEQMYHRAFPQDSEANKSNVIASLEKQIEDLAKGNENPKDGLEALAKLKEQIEKYENHLKDIGDKND